MAAARKPLLVPQGFALLCEFANSLDLRRFVEGVPHATGDKLATIEQAEKCANARKGYEA